MSEVSGGMVGMAGMSEASLHIVSHTPGEQPRFVCRIEEEFLLTTEHQCTCDFQTSICFMFAEVPLAPDPQAGGEHPSATTNLLLPPS